jgi:CubicO group peptidase (beta-lactamase class C family)
VERGKLDLDRDVNTYLDFKIPATYPQPITLRHLLTHTPGLEDSGRDLFNEDSTAIVPLGKWLATHMPGRVRPPGTFSSYSNWGAALAGYIVERVSGESWDVYIERNILARLGMTHTSGRSWSRLRRAPCQRRPRIWRASCSLIWAAAARSGRSGSSPNRPPR